MCKGWEYPLPLYVPSFIRKRARGLLITCCVVRLWPRVKSNAGSPDVERCKHVKSQATTVYFRLGKLRRVSTYVQHVWGIIGHVTVEAAVGTDGAPPQAFHFQIPCQAGIAKAFSFQYSAILTSLWPKLCKSDVKK